MICSFFITQNQLLRGARVMEMCVNLILMRF